MTISEVCKGDIAKIPPCEKNFEQYPHYTPKGRYTLHMSGLFHTLVIPYNPSFYFTIVF